MRKKLKIDHAQSMNNGILFYSKRHKHYVAIATINEEGISTEWITMKQYRKNRSKAEKIAKIKELVKLELSIFPFALVLSRLVTLAMTKRPIWGIRTFLLGFSLLLLGAFLVYTNRVKKQAKNLYQFHAAEHMALNAYKKLKRVPSLEEIHQYSRFHNDCGTNLTTLILVSFTLFFICSFIPNPLYHLIGLLFVTVIVFILLQCGLLNFLQNFTTIPPTDEELMVAIAGMNVWFENEKKEKEKSKFFKFLHRLFPRVFR